MQWINGKTNRMFNLKFLKENKKTMIKIIIIMPFLLALWSLGEQPVVVTYSQVFADKEIVVTEKVKIWESLSIAIKKGFVRYE